MWHRSMLRPFYHIKLLHLFNVKELLTFDGSQYFVILAKFEYYAIVYIQNSMVHAKPQIVLQIKIEHFFWISLMFVKVFEL